MKNYDQSKEDKKMNVTRPTDNAGVKRGLAMSNLKEDGENEEDK